MGHIKEPDGVDFIINGKPLTDKERKAISEFIKADKAKIARQKLSKSKTTNSKKLVTA
ncbi:hypothetical protein [Ferruginibacter sp.]|nr:hypothetical protein [Ferruginibacter sp.]